MCTSSSLVVVIGRKLRGLWISSLSLLSRMAIIAHCGRLSLAHLSQLSSAVAAGEGKAALAPVVAALRTCASVFYSLNVVDLPEYFEDHIAEWMAFFHKYLTFSHPALAAAEDDIEEGPLEALQTAILDCVGLYADKYDEEFEPFFPTFVTDVWSLLSAASATR